MEVLLLTTSIVAQTAAAALAVRLNLKHGRRWAWSLIAAGLVAMVAPRLVMVVHLLSGSVALPETYEYEQELSTAATAATCAASILILVGVAFIGPVFRAIERAESILLERNSRLEATVRHSRNELALARRIQRRLLPRRAPEIPGIEVSAVSFPADSVGGDYFDYFPLRNGQWVLLVSDVSGHGVGPALQMAQIQTLFHAIANTVQNPAEMLTRTNRLLRPFTPLGRFVSAFIGFLDPETRCLQYSTAGHIAWILRAGSDVPEPLRNEGLVLGVVPDADYMVSQTFLEPGDVLVLVTDGVTETFSPDGRLFCVHRLLDTVRRHRIEHATGILDAITTAVRDWRGTAQQHDDVTAMIVRASQDGRHQADERSGTDSTAL